MRGRIVRRRVWYKNKKILIPLICVLLLIAVGAFTLQGISGSASGSVDNSANFVVAQKAAPPKLIRVSGINMSFSYLDSFRPTPSQKPSGIQLENFNYVTKKSPFWSLAVGVNSLPSNKLSDDGSYVTRTKNPSQYKLEQWQIGGSTIPVFADTVNSYSKAAFILHNSKVATVALSGGGDESQMDSTLKDVLASMEWKQ